MKQNIKTQPYHKISICYHAQGFMLHHHSKLSNEGTDSIPECHFQAYEVVQTTSINILIMIPSHV